MASSLMQCYCQTLQLKQQYLVFCTRKALYSLPCNYCTPCYYSDIREATVNMASNFTKGSYEFFRQRREEFFIKIEESYSREVLL